MMVCFLSERTDAWSARETSHPVVALAQRYVGIDPRANTGHTKSSVPASYGEGAIAWLRLSHSRIGVEGRNAVGLTLQGVQVRINIYSRPSAERNLSGLARSEYCVGDPLALPAVFLSEASSSIRGEHHGITP
jgi:hypothetical protein